jgi:tRNA G18 (ribose-2'-O)-methylase SpoU
MILPIGSIEDERLEPYLRIRERDLLRRDGCFVVEGRVPVEALIKRSRFTTHSLFLAESRVKPLSHLLERLAPETPVYVAPQALMDAVVGFPLHRGVLALAGRGCEMATSSFLQSLHRRPSATLLGLVGLSNHDNVGACFRNATALGAAGVLLDQECCDPLYRKAIRVSSGAALSLPYARSRSGSDMISDLIDNEFEVWALSPHGGDDLETLIPPMRLALLLGAEGPGLSGDLMRRARRVSIAMDNGADSVNVATAGALALWRVRNHRASYGATGGS